MFGQDAAGVLDRHRPAARSRPFSRPKPDVRGVQGGGLFECGRGWLLGGGGRQAGSGFRVGHKPMHSRALRRCQRRKAEMGGDKAVGSNRRRGFPRANAPRRTMCSKKADRSPIALSTFLMRWINSLERRFGGLAIPGLIRIVVVVQCAGLSTVAGAAGICRNTHATPRPRDGRRGLAARNLRLHPAGESPREIQRRGGVFLF